MVEERVDAFTIEGYGGEPTEGVAEVVSFDRRARWARALGGLGVSWGVGAGAVFIPVAHFLLVPGAFLFGLYLFASRMQTPEITRRVHGTCPDCGVEQDFEAGGAWKLPRSLRCGSCSRSLRAREVDREGM